MIGRRLRALAVEVGMAAVIVGVMIASVASASSRVRSHQPPVVRPHFQSVGEVLSPIWTGARYALAAPAALPGPPPYSPATLIDDQSGQIKTIAQAGCYPVQPSVLEPLDLPWVPFNCGWPGHAEPELYSPATGQWQAVSPSPGAAQSCDSSSCRDDYLTAAGRYWLEYNHSICDSGNQHCSSDNLFQNIATGELRPEPSGATTTVDLNAPNLTRTVCRPLRVPTIFEPPVPGSLIFYGSFAVSIGGDANNSVVYLERCGTHLHRLLTTAPLGRPADVGANTHEVVWMARPGPILNALTLPGLRPFTITLPNRLVARTCSRVDYSTCVAQIALTNQRLYLLTVGLYYGHLWATPNPRPAKHWRK